jgi:hypothetical protein
MLMISPNLVGGATGSWHLVRPVTHHSVMRDSSQVTPARLEWRPPWHMRKKVLYVEDDREIAASGLSASNGTSCLTDRQSQDGVRNPGHNVVLLVLRLMISSRLANGHS